MPDPNEGRDYGIDCQRNTHPKMRSPRAHLAYLRYLMRHKWFVLLACRRTGTPMWRGLVHDMSKFRPSEWFPYLRTFYDPLGDKQYEPDPDFDLAWLLHQRRNPHHWQAWILRADDGGSKALRMPEAFAREMVADWIGAGRAISGRSDPRPWYDKSKHKMKLHPETRALVEQIMDGLEGGNGPCTNNQ
jgi:Family of unknown function (DUF5662)